MTAIIKKWLLQLRWFPVKMNFQRKGFGDAWRILTHMTIEERLLLYHLGRKQPEGATFVEIGSYLGASSCFLAAGASEIRGGAKVYCVDTWNNESMSEGPRDTWLEFKENTFRYRTIIVSLRGHSVEVARDFHEQIDLLFIDGDHSYEGCRADVAIWLPHLKPGGLVIMHDYGWAEGVKKVVQEFISPRATKAGRLQNLYWAWIK